MDRDDALRKARSLQAIAANKGATPEEAESAGNMAKKLIDRFDITMDEVLEEEPEPGLFDGLFDGFYARSGMSQAEIKTMKRNSQNRWDEFQRLKKEGVNAVYRIQAFLTAEDNSSLRDKDVYKDIKKQLDFATAQLKQCVWCHDKGFGPDGSTQRYALGKTKTGRDRHHEFHPSCWEAANKFWSEQADKQMRERDDVRCATCSIKIRWSDVDEKWVHESEPPMTMFPEHEPTPYKEP